MKLPFIRPEDRRRSGGSGAGPGWVSGWADTEPGCFRSEAFAEDLPRHEVGQLQPPPRVLRPETGARRPRRPRVPSLGSALVAAFRLRPSTGD